MRDAPKNVFTKSRRFFLLTLFLVVPHLVYPVKYIIDNYGVKDGLSSSKIYTILQDHNDLLWLGTEDGVTLFDGKDFQDFTFVDGMAENGVFSILEDSRGNLWFGHLDGGITRYDGLKFEVIRFDSLDIKGDITSFTETADHKIWITTSASGAYLIENPFGPAAGMKVRQYVGKKGLSDRIFSSFLSKDSTFYCLSDVGIRRYLPEKDSFGIFTLKHFTHFFSKTCMLEDHKGNFWFGTYHGGLLQYDKEKDSLIIYDSKRDGLGLNWVTCLLEDSKGDIWAGTYGGGVTRIRDGKLKTYDQTNGLNGVFVQSLAEDHEGNILIGSRYHGLNIFKGEGFLLVTEEDGLTDPSVWAIYESPEKTYWFGTTEGITVWDPSKPPGQQCHYYSRENKGIGNLVRFIVPDSREHLWIGTAQAGIFEYDPVKDRFFFDFFLNNRYLYRDMSVTALVVDKNNHLWVGTNDGVAYYDPGSHKGTRYTQGDGLVGNGITTLYYDRQQDLLWIGSERKKGLTCYDFRKKKFIRKIVSENVTPLTITKDPAGTLWIGTNIGLFAYDGDSLYLHLTVQDGLLANRINLVTCDDHGNIYIGTNKGLNMYVPSENRIVIFTRSSSENGGTEVRRNAGYKDRQGYLWFGTANGVYRFDTAYARRRNVEPLTHIRRMEVNYEPRRMVQGMKLSHNEKSIIFHYYSICLAVPDGVRYQVMLKGADADWRPLTTDTRATYSALSPGHYTFMVKARNSDGVWNSQPVTFSFTIRPPFYLTWWFILTLAVLLIAGIIAYIKIREKNLIREKMILERKVAQRTAEVVEKSKELEQKNKDITDSIRYAKRIQNAILPPVDLFSDTFVFFRPKDIVSGDFFWMNTLGTKRFIAAVDCTGHGVPGAFMSFIGYNSLNKIVNERHITEAATILDQLNEEVYKTLHVQSKDEDVKDGMDLALIVYDTKSRVLQYAGANNPMYFIREGSLEVIKADRIAIGMMSTDREKRFTNHTLKMKKGDMTYIFSDGYADQFGGPEGKKFKSSQLKKLLLEIHTLSPEEQKKILEETLIAWMRREEQVDDILVIGSRY